MLTWTQLNSRREEFYQDNLHLAPVEDWRSARPTEPPAAAVADMLHRSKKPEWRDPLAGGVGEPMQRPNDGPTAEWLAERDAAGDETSYGTEGNRIERKLVADKSPLVFALRNVAELMRPPVVAANDNAPAGDDGDGNPGQGMEREHNQGCFSPSIPEILRAYAPKLETSQRYIKGGWHLIGKTDGKRKLTGLIFHDGTLVAYGDDRGRKCRPSYNAKIAEAKADDESETARHFAAQRGNDVAYTKIKADSVYMSVQSPSAPRALAPPPRTSRAVANDNTLAAAIANTKAMPDVTRLPDGVAYEYGRLAGVADAVGVGDGKTSAPMHDSLAEMERADRLATIGFEDEDLAIVNAVLDDASFRTIALARGYAESSASRMGRRVVEDALKRISEKMAA